MNRSKMMNRSKKTSKKKSRQSSPDVVGPTAEMRKLSWILNLTFDREDVRHGMLMNRFIDPQAKMVSVGHGILTFYDADAGEHI
jgi:hypothetical protein